MCFSATGDIRATSEGASGCATAMRNLHKCMEKGGGGGRRGASSVSVDELQAMAKLRLLRLWTLSSASKARCSYALRQGSS